MKKDVITQIYLPNRCCAKKIINCIILFLCPLVSTL